MQTTKKRKTRNGTRYVWIVEFSVDKSWVADGFSLDNERAKDMLNREIHYAYGHEIGARVLGRPSTAEILVEQGVDPKLARKSKTVEGYFRKKSIERYKQEEAAREKREQAETT